MQARLDTILVRLALLRRFDVDRQVFGSSVHDWELRPPWTLDDVDRFEAEHGATLPDDFRAYLTGVSSGGAGPYYGLQDPAEPLVAETASLQRPFPLDRLWEPSTDSAPVPPATIYDGCIFLADQGCGYFDFLVVTGARAGEVWSDFTEADGPIGPTSESFLDWYEKWLNGALAELIRERRVELALDAPARLAELQEAIAEVESRLEDAPESPELWRTVGYVRMAEARWDDATAAFANARQYGEKEPDARYYLDLARLANAQERLDVALEEIDRGLSQDELWGSTRDALGALKVDIFDRLGRPDDALRALSSLTQKIVTDRSHHFEKAYRHLVRGEADEAWSTLEDAVSRKVGPAQVRRTMTRDDVYLDFASWLEERGASELAAAALEAAG